MRSRKFPILATTPVPPMLGRGAIMQRMLRALTKPIPDHLQVVGPRFAGKTVILHELARQLREIKDPFTAAFIWDLGHQTPGNDELFMQRLALRLSNALNENHADYAEHLKSAQVKPYQEIGEVLDALKDDGGNVLAIMDGFDKPLSSGQLTRNLWDQLRELGLKPSLRFLTASRRTLRELIRNPESQTSDFWNIFDPSPVHIGCFDDSDLAAILGQVPDLELSAGAHTELSNASNGFPVAVLEIINVLSDGGKTGEISADFMRAACEEAFPLLRDKMESLWDDCPPSCQDLFWRVLDERTVARTGIPNVDAEPLIDRGFICQIGSKLQRPNRLIERYLADQPNEGTALGRLFGAPENYQQNLKRVLERRLAQIESMDVPLKRYLERGIEDMPKHPSVFLTNVHGILEQVLTLVWKAECWRTGANRPYIPSDWFVIWRRNDEDKTFERWSTRFPEGGQRLRLLDLMTGTQKTDRLARFVTKNTYVLANAVQGFRDFGVHPKAAEVDLQTAYAGLHLCIELAASVTRELSVAT